MEFRAVDAQGHSQREGATRPQRVARAPHDRVGDSFDEGESHMVCCMRIGPGALVCVSAGTEARDDRPECIARACVCTRARESEFA